MKWSRHHLYYPSTWYTTPTERRFRSLPCNIVWLIRTPDHDIADLKPPLPKPSYSEMVEAINEFEQGQCGCSHHKKHSHELIKPKGARRERQRR